MELADFQLASSRCGADDLIPSHVVVNAVFAAANRHRMPIVVHTRNGPTYSAKHVEILLSQVFTQAPDVPIQVAHLWGGEAYSKEVLSTFANAVVAKRPGTQNLYFDIAEIWQAWGDDSDEQRAEMAGFMRQIGPERLLFGADGELQAMRGWRLFEATFPLTPAELATIANNVAPYAK